MGGQGEFYMTGVNHIKHKAGRTHRSADKADLRDDEVHQRARPTPDHLMTNDADLPILHDIEHGLVAIYESAPELSDAMVAFALDIGKIATKQHYGYAKSQNGTAGPKHQAIVNHVVAIGVKRISKDLTLDAYLKCVDQVKRSVERHRSDGVRGYYDFVKNYL